MSDNLVYGEDPVLQAMREKYGDVVDTLSNSDLFVLASQLASQAGDEGKTNLTMEDVKRCRLNNKLSQREFARLFDIPFGTYIQWESGRRNPPAYVLNMMQKHMHHIVCFREAGITAITEGAYLELSEGHFDMLRLTRLNPEGDCMISTKEYSSGTKDLMYQQKRYKDFTEKVDMKSIKHLA